MTDQFPKSPKKNLQDLPDKTKKKIIIITVSVIMIILIAVWVNAFFKTAKEALSQKTEAKPIINQKDWEQFKNDLNNTLEEGRNKIDEINEQINQLEQTTITPEISDEELENLKNKIIDLQSNQE